MIHEQDTGWTAIWRCSERDRWLLVRCREKGSDAELEEVHRLSMRTEDWIKRGSFRSCSYESHKSWNYLKYFTYSYIFFIFNLFPLFCCYSPVLLSFKSQPALFSCFLVPYSHFDIFLLLSIHDILQIFHILEIQQAVLLNLSHRIFDLYDDTVLNCSLKNYLRN